jgi:hypothetical protein
VSPHRAAWTRAADVAFVDDGERVVLLDLSQPGHRPQLLSGQACVVWRQLPGHRSDAAPSTDALVERAKLHKEAVYALLVHLEAAGVAVRRS